MAGSLGYYDYVSDNGSTYVIAQDDTNALAVGNTASAPGGTGIPTEVKPRYVTYTASVGVGAAARRLNRRIVVGDAASAAWTAPAPVTLNVETTGAVAFTPSSATGELRTRLDQFA